MTSGSGPILERALRREAAGDELLDAPECSDDPQRRVLRADEIAHTVDDHLQHVFDRADAGDATDGDVERLQLALEEPLRVQGHDRERSSGSLPAPHGSPLSRRFRAEGH